MENYDIGMELQNIKNLLFFMEDSLESLSASVSNYKNHEKDGGPRLAYAASQIADPLIALEIVIKTKVTDLLDKIDE